MEFQVSVSDGSLTSTRSVSVEIEDIAPVIISSAPSVYNGNNPFLSIVGITADSNGDYKLHWIRSVTGPDSPISHQTFGPDDIPTGQTDVSFVQSQNLIGTAIDVIMSGNTFHYIEFVINTAVPNFSFLSRPGLANGQVFDSGSLIFGPSTQFPESAVFTAIGPDKVLNVTSDRSQINNNYFLTSRIIDPDGTVSTKSISGSSNFIPSLLKDDLAAAAFADDSYAVFWIQEESANSDETTVMMQRVDSSGQLIDSVITVNEAADGERFSTRATTLTGGNVIVAWTDLGVTSADTDGPSVKARFIRPDGSASPEILINETTVGAQGVAALTPLRTNHVLVTWIDFSTGGPQLRGKVFTGNAESASNEFLIATGGQLESLGNIESATLTDNRVVLGWVNEPDQASDLTTHVVSFYPLGK